jgi:hypothetical protein
MWHSDFNISFLCFTAEHVENKICYHIIKMAVLLRDKEMRQEQVAWFWLLGKMFM